MLKKEYFAKILISFGIITLFTSIVNIISLLIPFQFKVAQWVYLFSQEISEKSIFPIIGILAIIGGTFICNFAKKCQESKCKCAVWAERLSAVLCLIFFTGLVTLAFVYTFNIKTLQNDVKTQIQGEEQKVKTQIAMMVQNNPNIKQENLQKGIQDLENKAASELHKAKKNIIINSIKILAGLISFAFLYLISAIYLFKN